MCHNKIVFYSSDNGLDKILKKEILKTECGKEIVRYDLRKEISFIRTAMC